MIDYSLTRKTVHVFAFFAVCIAVTLFDMPGNVEAGPKKTVSKSDSEENADTRNSVKEITYAGQVRKPSSVVSVKLIVSHPLAEGEKGATLSYGGTRQCKCVGTYEGDVDDKKTFSLLSENGGYFCDKCSRIEIKQASENGDTLSYTVFLSDKTTEEGTLVRKTK